MTTFLAILGILFIITIIGFLNSKQFKEYQNEQKSVSKNPLVKTGSQLNQPYYLPIQNLRKDGIYVLKEEPFIYVYAYLPNGKVSWFSEVISGSSTSDLFLLSQSINEHISHPALWSKETFIEGNTIVSTFIIDGKIKKLTGKLKKNGQLQIIKEHYDFNNEKTVEWEEYQFMKFS